jgi:hypothetical protein
MYSYSIPFFIFCFFFFFFFNLFVFCVCFWHVALLFKLRIVCKTEDVMCNYNFLSLIKVHLKLYFILFYLLVNCTSNVSLDLPSKGESLGTKRRVNS